MATDPPKCPYCGQPAEPALVTHAHDWECRNEACPHEGEPVLVTDSPSRQTA